MKNKNTFLLSSALLGGLIFNILFWNERIGFNLLIYSLFLLITYLLNSDIVKTAKFKIFAIAHLFSAVLVVVNNSSLSILTYYISLMLWVGYAHYPQIRSVFTAGLAIFIQLITVPINIIKLMGELRFAGFSFRPIFKIARYLILPLIIFSLFLGIYANANEVFGAYLNTFSIKIEEFLTYLLKDFDLPRILHFLFGFLITAGLTLIFFNNELEKAEAKCKEQLVRLRKKINQTSFVQELVSTFTGSVTTKKLALKTEHVIGLISFIALNLLILFLNIIDISTLWLGYKPTGNFSADLHDGTNALIFSIILAMAVIVFFFRGNLNFYSKNKTLKTLAYIWMFQNFILIISVFIRDVHYIDFYGLTHKRIGVLVFGLLCIIGLATVYLKVAKQKTLFYLFKINGFIWFGLLVAFSCINWDIFIVKYNLAHRGEIVFDPHYLFDLSDKTLAILDNNREVLTNNDCKIPIEEVVVTSTGDQITNRLNYRIKNFKERYKRVSWPSWNLPDQNLADYFKIDKK
jgi:hypothetical protein